MCSALSAYAQDEEVPEYHTEYDYGINWNTNGGLIGGGMFKYVQRRTENTYRHFGVEIVNVKHYKELTYPGSQNSPFIANKLNYLFVVRPQYGREFLLFRKAPEDGVQINAIIAGGPSIGLIKPYFIELYDPNNPTEPNKEVVYDPSKHNLGYIAGAGSPFDGIDMIKTRYGIHAKASLSFEFGSVSGSVIGAELGFLGEAYKHSIPLMYQATNRGVFGSAFLTLYYGSKK
ncbi:MAG: hypothetical protein V4543_14250 [Bacteroidota bacterium]